MSPSINGTPSSLNPTEKLNFCWLPSVKEHLFPLSLQIGEIQRKLRWEKEAVFFLGIMTSRLGNPALEMGNFTFCSLMKTAIPKGEIVILFFLPLHPRIADY
jgi:hypothetical protein